MAFYAIKSYLHGKPTGLKTKNMRRLSIILLLAGVLAIGLGYAYTQGSSQQVFMTAPVERGTIASFVKATGSVDAVITVDVSSQLSGRISEVLVNFNDEVKAGQAIARVDPEIFTARVNEAKAVLKVAEATALVQRAAIERARAAVANARTAQKMADAQTTAAKVRYDQAEKELHRKVELSRGGNVSDRDLSQSTAQRDTAGAELRASTEDRNMKAEAIGIAEAETRMAEANLQNAAAVVEQRQAALEQAELDLARTVIRAPIDGVIIKRDVNPGQTVAVTLEAKTLFKIAQDLREMEVRGKIDEADVGRLQVGQAARFTVDAYPDRVFTGRVLQIRKSPEVVQNVVTYTAIVSAPNPELLLLPGMTAVLRIVMSDTGETMKIPNQALRFRPSSSAHVVDNSGASSAAGAGAGTVWVVGRDGSPAAVNIALGVSDENSTQVLGDALQEGERLIVGVATPQSRVGALGLRLGF
jgi:HlyD family secretion protein